MSTVDNVKTVNSVDNVKTVDSLDNVKSVDSVDNVKSLDIVYTVNSLDIVHSWHLSMSHVSRAEILVTKNYKNMKFEVSGPKTHQIKDLDHYSGCQDMPRVKKRGPEPPEPPKIQKMG